MSDILTTATAICGAVTGTVALGWNITRDVRDRGRLTLHCFIGRLGTLGGGPVDDTNYLVCKITNVGRQALMVTHLGSKLNDGTGNHLHFNARYLPKMLAPGEYLLEHIHKWEQYAARLRDITVTDSFGHVYRAPGREVRAIRLTRPVG
jgi:hypothetical protein